MVKANVQISRFADNHTAARLLLPDLWSKIAADAGGSLFISPRSCAGPAGAGRRGRQPRALARAMTARRLRDVRDSQPSSR